MCGCIFRSVCGVRREIMQDKKVIADYFGFAHTKKGDCQVYNLGTGTKSTLWSKRLSGAKADGSLTVVTGGLGCEKD